MNFLIALATVAILISIILGIEAVNISFKYGWDSSTKKIVITSVSIGLASLSFLGWYKWSNINYIQSEEEKVFQVEVKNVPKGYRFEGYLVNRDTGERKKM